MKNKPFLFLVGAVIIMTACQKEDALNLSGSTDDTVLFVAQRGHESSGTSAIVGLQNDGDITPDLFHQTNGVFLMGEIVDLQLIDNRAIALCPASESVIILEAQSFEKLGEITGLTDARSIYILNAATAFVAAGTTPGLVYKLDLQQMEIVGVVAVDPFPSAMIHDGNRLFVNCRGHFMGMYQAIDILSLQDLHIMEKIPLDRVPRDWVKDSNGHLWQLRWGYAETTGSCDAPIEHLPKLVQIDPNTLETTSYELSTVSSLWPTSLNITPDGNTLYFLGNGVHQVKLNTDIQDQLLIDLEGVYMKINPANGELWIAQSNEFQDENKLVQFSANGVWKREYKLGNQPLTMAFIP